MRKKLFRLNIKSFYKGFTFQSLYNKKFILHLFYKVAVNQAKYVKHHYPPKSFIFPSFSFGQS